MPLCNCDPPRYTLLLKRIIETSECEMLHEKSVQYEITEQRSFLHQRSTSLEMRSDGRVWDITYMAAKINFNHSCKNCSFVQSHYIDFFFFFLNGLSHLKWNKCSGDHGKSRHYQFSFLLAGFDRCSAPTIRICFFPLSFYSLVGRAIWCLKSIMIRTIIFSFHL